MKLILAPLVVLFFLTLVKSDFKDFVIESEEDLKRFKTNPNSIDMEDEFYSDDFDMYSSECMSSNELTNEIDLNNGHAESLLKDVVLPDGTIDMELLQYAFQQLTNNLNFKIDQQQELKIEGTELAMEQC